ncbi:3-oxoacyl-ACP synthase [Tenacibaculum caenipelagi]|uniref:3-oxoacyl-ACP synthase n=1 Tax=Tenacibaculum caenipelagi TaxID=1325435 RepID=A0A4R6TF48_9FLAO|nr:3-oxoacyl-ACP synthase [Tenacibaculum caenipelagi]TDQ28857.1 hypothetical protein DFQ07_1238 [Tenacibaculum caenipelagi]
MKNTVYIKAYCAITNTKMVCNDEVLCEENELDYKSFLKSIYKNYCEVSYPKFFKMDEASKLAFLTAEVLLKNTSMTENEKEDLAIILSNKSASLNTDRDYQNSIQDKNNFYPSPAIFVYTLPNIGIGEICIRHKSYGENAFYITEKFDANLLSTYAQTLLNTNKTNNVLCGWVEVEKGKCSSFFYLLSNTEGELYSEKNINEIYQSI